MRKSLFLALSSVLAVLGMASGAQAANVIVGSPLSGPFTPTTFGTLITAFNSKLPSGSVSSPVDGVVVGWHLIDGSGGPYYLRVLKPAGAEYTAVGTSGPAIPLSTGIERFATALPIKAGQTVAIEGTNFTDGLGVRIGLGGEFSYFVPPLAEGATAAPGPSLGAEIGFNAEVQPAPTISGLGVTSGTTAGGTSVTITGTDFAEVKGVSFGSSTAPFTLNSESQITAATPAGSPGAVPVTVTTIAGTATASQQFTYVAPTPPPPPPAAITCKVPNVVKKTLKAAKKAVRKAHCKVGLVSTKRGVKAATGKVVRQSPKAGKVVAPHSPVSLKLG